MSLDIPNKYNERLEPIKQKLSDDITDKNAKLQLASLLMEIGQVENMENISRISVLLFQQLLSESYQVSQVKTSIEKIINYWKKSLKDASEFFLKLQNDSKINQEIKKIFDSSINSWEKIIS